MENMASNSTNSGFVDNWQENKTLAQCMLHMLTSEDSCDVTFLVGKNKHRVRCHRLILMSRSCVFHAMFCGPLAEKDNIKIPDVSKKLFKGFLKYLYTDECSLTPENVTGLLYLSKKYAVGGLEEQCRSFLEVSLCAENACTILEQAHQLDEKNLHEEALNLLLEQRGASLNSDGFKDLCRECFDKILQSDNTLANPEEVFTAALTWADAECKRRGKESSPQNHRQVLGESVYQIPFTSFEAEEFVKTVIPSQILSESEALKIMSYFALPGTDVSPFQKFQRIYEPEIFETGGILPFFRSGDKNKICVMLDCDMYLHGLVLSGGGHGAIYDISVKNLTENFLLTSFTSELASLTVMFSKCIRLTKNTEYEIAVNLTKGNSIHFPAKGILKQKIELGPCTMTMKPCEHGHDNVKLLEKLIIGKRPKGTTQ